MMKLRIYELFVSLFLGMILFQTIGGADQRKPGGGAVWFVNKSIGGVPIVRFGDAGNQPGLNELFR